jgi:hypothetical protein
VGELGDRAVEGRLTMAVARMLAAVAILSVVSSAGFPVAS